jgi:Protein of unknown function (DUF4236)
MSLRIWRRQRLFPGARINLSKSGVSLSVGRRGAWFTTGNRGQRVTFGAPGTGLFWTEHAQTQKSALAYQRAALLGLVAVAAIVLIWIFAGG